MTIPQELYELSSRDPDGCVWKGQRREIISGLDNATTAYQLKPEQSGALIVQNALTGSIYTLPTPVAGMWFEFFTVIACTSNLYQVTTKTITSEFILGTLTAFEAFAQVGDSGTAYPSVVATENYAIDLNGTTQGGLPGDNYILTAVSTTAWLVSAGMNIQSGSTADPWTT
jgi:hypothetical protein